MERRLAAILAVDVVGYSRLMEHDEAATFERLRAHRKELFEPQIEKHQGRIFKLMGDGLLAEFGSVVDAVECAVHLQRAMAERNNGLAAAQRIDVRMGINLGDIIIEGEDRHGDGVNIAARLEGLAEAGGIILSGTAYDQLKKKLDVGFEFLGERQVKNITEPIRVYRLLTDPEAIGKTIGVARAAKSWQWPVTAAGVLLLVVATVAAVSLHPWHPALKPEIAVADKASIVVLPFLNLSDDKEQEYLADGITEDMTTDLAQIPGLFVISRNAAFSYKGKDIQPAQVAAELGVRYLLEGSIRRAGETMRINAQLIDAKTGGHLWAERYDGAWADVFSLQDRAVSDIAQALELRLISGERAVAGGTSNVAAYEAFLKGWELVLRSTAEDTAKAIPLLEQAIALDPNYGKPYGALALAYYDASGGWASALGLSDEDVFKKMFAYMEDGLKHPTPEVYRVHAYVLAWQLKFDEAIAELERAIALDPSDANSYATMGEILTYAGRAADGKGYIDAAFRLDPRSLMWRHFFEGLVYFSLNQFDAAAATLKKDRSGLPLMLLELSSYGHLGRGAEAASLLNEINAYNAKTGWPKITILMARDFWQFKEPADRERLLDGLRKAGVPELPPGYDANSKDELTGEEVKALAFGHEFRGQQIGTGDPYSRVTSIDGATTVSLGSWRDSGISRVEDNTLCIWWPTEGNACTVIFRNPAGTFEQKNQYIWVSPYLQLEFSVVK